MTRMRNHRSRNATILETQSKNGDSASELILDATLSLSTPASDQDDVSFSSSEGSSYYSDTDVTSLERGQNKDAFTEEAHYDDSHNCVDEQVFDSSAQLAKALQDLSDSLRSDRTRTACHNQGAGHGQSKSAALPRPFSRTNPVTTDRRKSKEVSFQIPYKCPTAPFPAAIPLMEMVDCYSAIDSSSHSSIVSSTCFLTKANTNEVFCKRMIPLEIDADKAAIGDDFSAVSATVAGSTVPHPRRYRDGSSERAVHMHLEARPETEQDIDSNERVNLALIFVHGVSVPCQETLSSLESLSSWEDTFEEGEIPEATGSEDAVKPPTRKTLKRGNMAVAESQKEVKKTGRILPNLTEIPSHQDEGDMKDMQDLSMDERIRQLKKKIRKMQKSSNFEQSSSISIQTSTLSTSLADEQTSRQSSGRRLPYKALELEQARKIKNRTLSHAAFARQNLESTANSRSIEPPQVPKEIPLTDMDEISVIDCEIKPLEKSIHLCKKNSSYDIETGRESYPAESKSEQDEGASHFRQEKRNDGPWIPLQSKIQNFIDVGNKWADKAAVAVSQFVSGMVERYQARSLKDQILSATIAVGIFILFILIIVVAVN